ncbi:MAG: hypothetical protein CM15mV42_0430 [uncultured marine virus]|nr:MAG: hypothetical protein CM15mV42_0430 [uncultured marine virus]
MSTLKNQIIESFKWKKNADYCSQKLNISKDDYIKLKKEILSSRKQARKLKRLASDSDVKYDLENGKAHLVLLLQQSLKRQKK